MHQCFLIILGAYLFLGLEAKALINPKIGGGLGVYHQNYSDSNSLSLQVEGLLPLWNTGKGVFVELAYTLPEENYKVRRSNVLLNVDFTGPLGSDKWLWRLGVGSIFRTLQGSGGISSLPNSSGGNFTYPSQSRTAQAFTLNLGLQYEMQRYYVKAEGYVLQVFDEKRHYNLFVVLGFRL